MIRGSLVVGPSLLTLALAFAAPGNAREAGTPAPAAASVILHDASPAEPPAAAPWEIGTVPDDESGPAAPSAATDLFDGVAQLDPSREPPAGTKGTGPAPGTPRTPAPVGAAPKRKPKAEPEKPTPPTSAAQDIPQTVPGATTPTGTEVEAFMPLREALVLALRNNLDVEIARVEPAIADETVRQARGAYDPVASFGFDVGHDEVPTASAFQGGQVGSDDMNTKAGFNGILPFGLRYSSGYSLVRQESDSSTATLVREFNAGWVNQLTLPLMRDFGMNEAKVRVVRSELGKEISEDVFDGRLTEIIANVENLYWDVAATRAQVNVAHKSLKTAQDLLEQTRVQQEVGVVSRVAVTQAEAGVAERELNAIQAENAAAAAKDRLLNALLAPQARVYQDRDVIPEVPTFTEVKVDLEQTMANALQNRPDLAEARRRVKGAEVESDFAGNQVRPRFDLVASYTMRGLAGKSKLVRDTFRGEDCATVDPLVDPNRVIVCNSAAAPGITGSGSNTFSDFFGRDANQGYTVGAQFEYALGNRVARGTVNQRNIELRRARAQLRRAEQVAILEVREAVRGMDSAAKAVGAGERRRSAAAETLRAEQERLRLGDSTPFQVLQFEEDLADAERQVIDALRSHRNAITRVEQVQGTLLRARAIDVQDELDRPAPTAP